MLPAFVFGWPTGQEKGDYLALDLGTPRSISSFYFLLTVQTGGTNLRVCLVTLEGEGKYEITQTKYRLTEEQKHVDGEILFDFCAESVASFIHSSIAEGVLKDGQDISMGFTVRLSVILSKRSRSHENRI